MAATTITRATLTDSTSPSTGDIWNAALVGTAIYDKVDLLFASSLTISRSSSGDIALTVENTSNTSGSDAALAATVGGTSAGDPSAVFTITGATAWAIGLDNSDNDLFKIAGSATLGTTDVLCANTTGHVFINDTADTDVTTGLTINQGGADNVILALKSSDVAHGITSQLETDTFGTCAKVSATSGGLRIAGWSSGTGGMQLLGAHTTDDTVKSTAATGAVIVDGSLKSGTTVTGLGANANIIVFRTNGTTRFILDADGDSHEDVGTAWTNFDDFDDIALLTALSGAVSRADDPLKAHFGGWLQEHRAVLQQQRIVTINDGPGEDGSVFINWSRTHMLLIGALRQLAARIESLEAAA